MATIKGFSTVTISEVVEQQNGKPKLVRLARLYSLAKNVQERCEENWKFVRFCCPETRKMHDLTYSMMEETNLNGGTNTYFQLHWQNPDKGFGYFHKKYFISRMP